ncbi:MAG: sodium:solute symporter family protein, partial [Verrucomicrobiota bacterium]|nr:sodium:solute symporter family protein [Verrucomicrobiota bacterium]
LFSAGVLAAIMSSLDSQFVCIGSMFTNDFIVPLKGEVSDKQKVWLGRGFIVFIVFITYIISIFNPTSVFNLGVWCFSGFSALFPIAFASVYWKRLTKAGVIASVLATAVTWALFIYDALGNKGEKWFGEVHAGEYLIAGVMPVTFICLASVVALVGVSLFTKAPSQATIDRFFPIKKA